VQSTEEPTQRKRKPDKRAETLGKQLTVGEREAGTRGPKWHSKKKKKKTKHILVDRNWGDGRTRGSYGGNLEAARGGERGGSGPEGGKGKKLRGEENVGMVVRGRLLTKK